MLSAVWRGTVLMMIFALGLVACSLAYGALFGLTAGAWRDAARSLSLATLAAVAVGWLYANREHLVEA
ncbi:MAG: hypothetical protein EOP68_25650 [Sphingomonas sp.]|nr:MAG: hypothetical protein EOP68_25650 [Sphingomonas sp.]